MIKKKTQTIPENINLPSYFVGIGASAGGLEALEEFLKKMPADTDMAFIIVQHLSPDYKSLMVELLSRKTKMKVLQIEDGMMVEANTVYLVPPKKNLEIYHSQLILTDQIRDTGLNLPIDIFFRSLAADKGKYAIGIILSGTGSDGTLGVKAIKEHGGLVMVQDYKDAKFDGMPKSAMSTGLVDYILEGAQMSEALVKFIKHPLVKQASKEEPKTKAETDFVKILSIVRTKVGEDFSYYKPKTIIRRIERRISVNQLHDADEYIQLLLQSPKESEILSREFLIGVTQFFRDKEAFEILEQKVIPELFKNKEDNMPARLWSVACSTGEEAYSIAILCKEYLRKSKISGNIQIFATDLDKEAVRFAGQGIYPESIVSDVPPDLLERYFIKKREAYQIIEEVRQSVIFSSHNVISDPPFSKVDLISCRNLLIYFKLEMQEKVLALFQYSLQNDGFLFLGSSESLSAMSDIYDVIDSKSKIFRHKKGIKVPLLSNLLRLKSIPREREKQTVEFFPVANPPTSDIMGGEIYEKIVNHLAPAGMIIDSNSNIIHLFKDAQKYLVFPEGKPSYNLIEIANPQISMVLSNMLYKVRKEAKEVVLKKVKFEHPDGISYLNLTARPVVIKKGTQNYVLILIEKEQDKKYIDENPENVFDFNEQAAERIKELEREIQYRDENLQTTIEELETSNEELQATNEELVSSNEELQSTNEELQSVNEELYTVNSQYQEKINELTTLNNDVTNLLTNTQIGTLFLDSNLTVRKFTLEITKIINVMEIDIGRPFKHLTLNCNYPEIYDDVVATLDSLKKKEVEVLAENDEWYLVKIQPYRHEDKSIHGILITMVDISALQKSREKFKILFETMMHGVVYQDANGKIISANPAAERILGLSLEKMLGLTSIDPRWKAIRENGEEFPGDEHPAMIALKTGEIVKNVLMGVFNPANNAITWIRITATPLFKKGKNKPYEVYAIFEDITGQRASEMMLKETEEDLELSQKKYQMLFNSLKFGFAYHKIITDKEGLPIDYQFIKINDAFEKLTGLKKENVVGKTIKNILPDIEDFWIEMYGRVALENKSHDFEHYSASLNKNFKVHCYSPEKEYFAAIFEEV
jgi:two-component system CheB/CheR fusion protein